MLLVYCPEPVEGTDQIDELLDDFNHPRRRRRLILAALRAVKTCPLKIETIPAIDDDGILATVYGKVHSSGLLDFLQTAWQKWEALGEGGRDPSGSIPVEWSAIPPLVPSNAPLPRLDRTAQRPSGHVVGQMGYYCTETCTPIYEQLRRELHRDAAVLQCCLDEFLTSPSCVTRYLLLTHPGHHSAHDSFGGYCYVNHAAALASHCSSAVILDLDYHAGNGTISICASFPSITTASIHCDPNFEYPFHSGFLDENTNSLRNVPLPPGTTWEGGYKTALLETIAWMKEQCQSPDLILISLGLDTLSGDPCAIRRAGLSLEAPADYEEMGRLLATHLWTNDVPVTFVQEGGYRMDAVGAAAAGVVTSFVRTRHANQQPVAETPTEYTLP